jgi:hypothetical protein
VADRPGTTRTTGTSEAFGARAGRPSGLLAVVVLRRDRVDDRDLHAGLLERHRSPADDRHRGHNRDGLVGKRNGVVAPDRRQLGRSSLRLGRE